MITLTANKSDSALARYRRVLVAVMLRNIRTRFFGNGTGFIISLLWPLTHIFLILTIFAHSGRAAPYGESIYLFIATGTVPFMVFSYMARFMLMAVISSRPLLYFPEVKTFDVIFASAILELIAACIVSILFIIIAIIINVDVIPRDIVQASYAFGVSVLLGFGVGIVVSVLAFASPIVATIYALLTIILWMTSGVVFLPDSLPEPWRGIASYHPVLQCIEWMRSAYYEGYSSSVLDKGYIIEFGVLSVFLGLIMERGMRGYILAQR